MYVYIYIYMYTVSMFIFYYHLIEYQREDAPTGASRPDHGARIPQQRESRVRESGDSSLPDPSKIGICLGRSPRFPDAYPADVAWLHEACVKLPASTRFYTCVHVCAPDHHVFLFGGMLLMSLVMFEITGRHQNMGVRGISRPVALMLGPSLRGSAEADIRTNTSNMNDNNNNNNNNDTHNHNNHII